MFFFPWILRNLLNTYFYSTLLFAASGIYFLKNFAVGSKNNFLIRLFDTWFCKVVLGMEM